jgi:anaerobic magnesium-protoporphyrin IX monomethyl ester cyclase
MSGGSTKSPKVLLVRPPQQFTYGTWPRGPRLSVPTGLLAIASYLKKHDVNVSIYDAFVEGDDFDGDEFKKRSFYQRGNPYKRIAAQSLIHSESGSLPPGVISRDFSDTVHFGSSWEQIASHLRSSEPDIIGITNLFRENANETMRFAKLAKAICPNALIIVGGPNANAQPEELLRTCSAIDLIGLGDGERTMLRVTEYMAGHVPIDAIPGIVAREGRDSFKTVPPDAGPMNLDEYGALDYSLVRLERYFAYERGGIMARSKYLYPGSERSVSMVTSRGCPYHCSFCSIHIHAGRMFRRHSVSYLITQLEHLLNDYGVKHIHFEDDNLALDKRRFIEFLREIIRRELKFTWDTPNGIFAQNMDESTFRLMKEAGCTYTILGVESGNQWVLDNVINKRPLNLDTVLKVFRAANSAGLDVHAFYVIGFPRETMAQIDETLEFAWDSLMRYDVLPHLALARADPGTSLYREAVATNTLVLDFPIANPAGVRTDMFTRHLIKTDEFDPHGLQVKNDEFHRRCIKYLIKDRILFLLLRPIDLCDVLFCLAHDIFRWKMSPKQALIKLLSCKLLYKNAIRERGKQSYVARRSPIAVSRNRRDTLKFHLAANASAT